MPSGWPFIASAQSDRRKDEFLRARDLGAALLPRLFAKEVLRLNLLPRCNAAKVVDRIRDSRIIHVTITRNVGLTQGHVEIRFEPRGLETHIVAHEAEPSMARRDCFGQGLDLGIDFPWVRAFSQPLH